MLHKSILETEEVAQSYLDRIVNILVLNSSFIASIGLEGKMGVCVLFFELYEKTKRKELFMFASKLLDELFSSLESTKDVPIGVSNGVCGLGIGLSYLKKKRFVDCGDQAVFPVLDEAILSSPIATTVSERDFLSKELYYFSRFGFNLTETHFVDYSKLVLRSLLNITSEDHILSNQNFLSFESLSNVLYLLNGLKSGGRNENIASLLDKVIVSLCQVIVRKPSLIKYDSYSEAVLRQLEVLLTRISPKDFVIRQSLEKAITDLSRLTKRKLKKNDFKGIYGLFQHFYVFQQHDIYFNDMDRVQTEKFIIEQFENNRVLDCQIKELLNVGYMIRHVRRESKRPVVSILARDRFGKEF